MNVIKRAVKVVVEGLEGRLLLAAHTWTGGGGDSNWSDASNWTGGAPASAESNVTLDFPSGVSNATANNDITGLTIHSISIEGTYLIEGVAFSLSGSISTSGAASASISNDIALASNSTLNLVGQLNLGGIISGSFNLQQSGGSLYVSGNNTYTGTTTIASGLLYLGSNTGLGSTSGGTIVDSGGAIMLDLGLTCAEPLTLSGSGVSPGGLAQAALFVREASAGAFSTSATWSGAITLSGGASVAGRPASDGGVNGVQTTLDITGGIGGTGNLTIANGGVILGGNNTFPGNTIVSAGALKLDSAGMSVPGSLTINGGSVESMATGQIGSTAAVSLASSTTLTIDSGDTETVASLFGSGTINGGGTLIDDTGANDTFSGPMGGSVSFTMNGIGRLTVGGSTPDTTTGTITLSHGQMMLDATFTHASLNHTAGEIFGTGTVASFDSTGGDMEPGDFNPGILNSTGSLHLDTGSEYDWVAVSSTIYAGFSSGGTVTLAGNFDIADLAYTPVTGTVFTLINNTGSSPVSGTFAGMPEGHIISFQNADWKMSYTGGNGNDVTLTYLGLPTTVSASVNSASAVLGQAVLKATVGTSVGGAPTPTGNVTFKNGSTVLGITALNNSGMATFDATSLPVGSYTITAYYDGDSVFETSGPSSSASQTVTQASSTLGLGTSAGSIAWDTSVTLTATVGSGGIPVVPSGTVTFSSNGTSIGTANVNGSGVATLAIATLHGGDDAITASYGGDSNFTGSATSSPVGLTVIPGVSSGNATVNNTAANGTASFTLTLGAPSSLTVTVNYATQDGSALAGRDYEASSGTVTFSPGQTSKTIAVTTLGDGSWQPDRKFSINYSSIANASMATTFSTATIQSTDGMPAGGLIADELDPTRQDLVIDAPAGSDTIQLKATKVAGQVEVMINHKVVMTQSGLDRVILYGGSANNTLSVDPRVGAGVIFFGGGGRTVAVGGSGNDILVGGAGANTLSGGGGMNLLIGGTGKATLKGSAAGDVLVGGATEYDAGTMSDILSLETLLSTWTDGGAYTAREAALAAANGPSEAVLDQATMVFNPADHLTGKKNHDLLVEGVVTKSEPARK